FSYFTRLDNEMKEIEQLEDLAREVGEDTFKIPRWIVVWKMLKAISQEKRYQLKIHELLQKPPSEFLRISASRLRQDIQILHTNQQILTDERTTHTHMGVVGSSGRGGPRFNQPTHTHIQSRPPTCREWRTTGRCGRYERGQCQ